MNYINKNNNNCYRNKFGNKMIYSTDESNKLLLKQK